MNPRLRKLSSVLLAFLLGLVIGLSQCAHAQPVPTRCAQYERTIVHDAFVKLGLNAPIAVFGAQIMQESSCDAAAHSAAGASGLAQFIPDTAEWVGSLDSQLTPANPTNPAWAIRAQITYMAWLMQRDVGKTECDTYAFALSSYNGGEGWLRRDQARAVLYGFDKLVWFGAVELTPDKRRSTAAIIENRNYPKSILLQLSPRFVSAGWGRNVLCN